MWPPVGEGHHASSPQDRTQDWDRAVDDLDTRRREQHKQRFSWMPWLYFSLKPRHRAWAEAWQKEVQDRLRELETVEIAVGCFISPEAKLFAEPGRPIRIIGPGVSIAA